LKPGWTKSWLCASALMALALPGGGVLQRPPHPGGAGARHNELQLAGLRPGKDKLAAAVALYGRGYRRVFPDSGDLLAWVDHRAGRVLRVDVSGDGTLETVALSAIDSLLEDKTTGSASLPGKMMMTGRGLELGGSCSHAAALYGSPGSSGPSTRGSRELQLLFYAFDWAGSDVPQVMEVYCDHATGRVVEITLAAQSL
jgi:hypothetical protein